MIANNPSPQLVSQLVNRNGTSQAKSSTERGREFRKRQRELGGKPSGMLLSSQARLAIELIKQVRRKPYKVRIMEEALVCEAKRLCPCVERLSELVKNGLLDEATADGWKQILIEEELKGPADESCSAVSVASKKKDRIKYSTMKMKRVANSNSTPIHGHSHASMGASKQA